jgi:nucleotide-binding universal stress UspA family protein
MAQNKILVPTDFSSTSQTTLDWAAALARDRGATMLVVHVEEPKFAYYGDMYVGMPEPNRDDMLRMLSTVVPKDTSVKCEHRLLVGPPADAIVDLAEREDVEMIVMPTHGRTGLSRLLMGSVAEQVVRKAKCPVMTIRAGMEPAPKK